MHAQQSADSLDAPTMSQSTTGSPAPPTNPHSAFPIPQSAGRPRALNAAKRQEILELLSMGFVVEHAARQVGCSARTIRREVARDPQFAEEIGRSEKYSLQNPLGALQHALHRNWRAAAWLLERLYPERFARQPQKSGFGKRQARQLLDEVRSIVNAEVLDSHQRERIDGRVRTVFEYLTHVYCAPKRSAAGLNRAIELFERKDRQNDPFASLGALTNQFTPTETTAPIATPAKEQSSLISSDSNGQSSPARPKSVRAAFQDLLKDLQAITRPQRSKSKTTPKPAEVLSPTTSSEVSAADKTDKMDKTTDPSFAKHYVNS